MKKTVFVFSSLIIALLVLFQLSKYAFVSSDASAEFFIAGIAVIFLLIGFYLKKQTKLPSTVSRKIDNGKIKELGISDREYQVLLEISNGLSNKEIGQKLFVSESTIKTHVSNLLVKLDAKRRTQAIQKAKELQIIVN